MFNYISQFLFYHISQDTKLKFSVIVLHIVLQIYVTPEFLKCETPRNASFIVCEFVYPKGF